MGMAETGGGNGRGITTVGANSLGVATPKSVLSGCRGERAEG